jgi:uncharacterized protein
MGNDISELPHLPTPAVIDAYGNGGFRFAGLSHRGSLLCLPDGIWAWPVAAISDLSEEMLAPVFARAEQLDFFLLGAGSAPWPMPAALRARLRALGLSAEAMATGAAVRTWNILLAENRCVAAGLIAVH